MCEWSVGVGTSWEEPDAGWDDPENNEQLEVLDDWAVDEGC
jgi:hypothetical protein